MNPLSRQLRVAFLGLGIMGGGMARRIAAAGFPLAVYNRNRGKAAGLTELGVRVASSPREAAEHADVVLSMVADDSAARAVWLGRDGAMASLGRGAVAVECSTVSVDWVRELGAAACGRGAELLDAPVTGSRIQAAAGELNFLVGGTAETLERVRPVLATMSKTVLHLGAAGSGALVKLINNFVCGVQIGALAEAVALIERSGLERERALGVLINGAPGSPLVKAVGARMTTGDYTPNFLLRLMGKDLTYAIEEGARSAVDLTTARAALKLFQQGTAAGHGEKDIAAVVEPLRGGEAVES